MYLVQSVIFDKSKFSSETARNWLLANKYKDKGVDEKKKFWRFRQLNPLTIKRKGYSHYITKPLEQSGVELIIAYKEKLEGGGKLNQVKKELFKREVGGKLQASEVKEIIAETYNKKPASNIGEWMLDKDLSTSTATVYYNPRTKEAVVSHRGTQGAMDWGNNVAYALGAYKLTDRYKQGKAVQKKADAKYGKQNISTVGHSQGSILARELGGDTKEIINVNPAYSFEKPKKNEYNIRSEADVVSGMYAPVAKVRSVLFPEYSKKHDITISSDNKLDVLGNHSADILDKLGDQEIGKGAKNNNIYISGKGLKDKSSIYSKDKMTQQEAKLYMTGIMNTGGSLDISQDLAFRLKYSFKVGELKKMLKELSVEGRINLTPKEIRKLKKQEIIDMVVEGKLIDPPELPTKVALAKKFKVGDLKKEALEHAKTVDDSKTFLSSIRKLKKADLINYIDLNQLWAVAEEQPNIQLSIEEKEESEPTPEELKKELSKRLSKPSFVYSEPELEASLPSGNPKAQMKGIKIGNKVMPYEELPKKKSFVDEMKEIAYKFAKAKEYTFKTLGVADKLGNAYSYIIFKEDDEYYYYFTDITIDDDDNRFISARLNEDGKMPLDRFDKAKKRFKKDEFNITDIITHGTKKMTVQNSDDEEIGELIGKDEISEFISNPDNVYLRPLKSQKAKSKKGKKEVEPEEDVIQEVPAEIKEQLTKEYIEKGYDKVDAKEAVERDLKYSEMLRKKSKGKMAEDIELPPKPLTNKEKGDEREASYFLKKTEEIKKDPKLLEKLKERQAVVLKNTSSMVLPPEILRVMIYEDFKTITDLPKVFKFLDDERGYSRIYLK